MANLWEDIKKFVKDGATAAADKFDEETTLWKIHRDISNLKKSVDAQKMQLGAHVYDILKTSPETNFTEDEKVNAFITEVDNLLKKVAEKQDEYDEFKKVTEAKRVTPEPEAPPPAGDVPETPEAEAAPAPKKPGNSTKKQPKATKPPVEPEQ